MIIEPDGNRLEYKVNFSLKEEYKYFADDGIYDKLKVNLSTKKELFYFQNPSPIPYESFAYTNDLLINTSGIHPLFPDLSNVRIIYSLYIVSTKGTCYLLKDGNRFVTIVEGDVLALQNLLNTNFDAFEVEYVTGSDAILSIFAVIDKHN